MSIQPNYIFAYVLSYGFSFPLRVYTCKMNEGYFFMFNVINSMAFNITQNVSFVQSRSFSVCLKKSIFR